MIRRAGVAATSVLLGIATALPAAAALTLRVGDHQGASGSEIAIPIVVENADKLGPVQFEMTFDPDVLEPVGIERGALLAGAVESFVPRPGQLNVGTITQAAIEGDGELVAARFRVKGGSGAWTALEIRRPLAFEYGRLTDQLVDVAPGSFRATGRPGWVLPLLALLLVVTGVVVTWRLRRRSRSRSAAAPAPLPRGRFCTACGSAVEATARFCAGCGHPVAG